MSGDWQGPDDMMKLIVNEPDEITEWSNWSMNHILSASHFAQLSFGLEQQGRDLTDVEVSIRMYAYATGAVFMSVAFLEATINELFLGAAMERRSIPALSQQLSDSQAETLVRGWSAYQPVAYKTGDKRLDSRATQFKPTLLKYQDALVLLGQNPFDESIFPCDDARVVIWLRNELIHFQPRWTTTYSTIHPEKVKTLPLKGRFPLSPLLPPRMFSESIHRYIGHGLAEWAVKSSFEVSEQFHSRLGLKPVNGHLKVPSFGQLKVPTR